MVKSALVALPGIVTLSGTSAVSVQVAAEIHRDADRRRWARDPDGPVADAPPVTVVGVTVIDVSAGRLGYSVNGCDSVTPPPETEIVTVVGAVTGAVVMSKNPMPLTAATLTESGTAASDGVLLATCRLWSCPTPSAVLTTP